MNELLVDTGRIAANAAEIRLRTGAKLLPVIKADGYGTGACQVALALRDNADGFCVFGLSEAVQLNRSILGNKPVLALGPLQSNDPRDYLAQNVTPVVSSVKEAQLMLRARPALCVDVGMRRFACPAQDVLSAIVAGDIHEVFAHATTLAQVDRFIEVLGDARESLFCHAAGSSLLAQPMAYLDAVRPGMAIYRGAITVRSILVEVHHGDGPAGYSQFQSPCHGVVLTGYHQGLRPGPCLINGRRSRIIEVGMQSAFVETAPADRVGDAVLLLAPELDAIELASSWHCSAQEVLVRLAGGATHRIYCGAA